MHLEIRRKPKLIKIYQRTIGTELEFYLDRSRKKRLKKSTRQSFGQQLERTLEELELNCETAQVIRTKDLEALLLKQWKIQVERDRNPNKTYNESEYRLKYKAYVKYE